MDRAALLEHLDRYAARYRDERPTVDRIRTLLREHDDCFERRCYVPGHVTASAWIVSRETRSVLLTHHRKLDRWLQLGGHTDGEPDVVAAALREAEEESGLSGLVVHPVPGPPEILDVDVHVIPARGTEPGHEHHDIRFLLEASEAERLERSEAESKAMRWFRADELARVSSEESLLRMAHKAARWLEREPIGPS